MRKTKVLIISEPGGGGVARHVVDLLKNLDKNRFEVFFVYSSARADNNYLNKINKLNKTIKMFAVDEMQQRIDIVKDFIALKKIINIIKNIQPDIVHCHSSKAGVLGRIAAKLCGIKKIFYTPHAYAFQNPNLSFFKKNFYIIIEKIMTKYFTYRTINVSESERDIALKSLNDYKKKFVVINNGVDKDDFDIDIDVLCEKYKILPRDYVVGNISRLEVQKNPLEFFKIAKGILHKDKNIKFMWIGNGSLYGLTNKFIIDNNMEDRCLLIPYDEGTEHLIKRFDVFLCTSLYEGYPYVLLDACVNGIPIVCSNVEGNNNIVVDNVNGFLYTLGNIHHAEDIIYKIKGGFLCKEYNLSNIATMVINIEKEYMIAKSN